MNEYVIITDSSCDLPETTAKKFEISAVPLSVFVDEKKYTNYLDGREISSTKFFELLRQGKKVTTCAANIIDFENTMKHFLSLGKDILYLGFSSALSCTYSTGFTAADKLKEEYPNRKIYTIDTLCASLGQGLLVYLASLEKQSGKTIEEVRDFVENLKLKICHWFTVDSLQHLKNGGRISAATAIIGGLLNIKPIMHMDNNGKLVATGKIRGRKASIDELFNKVKSKGTNISEQSVFISHGDCEKDAKYLADNLKDQLKVKNILINNVGPVIGSHSGPGTLAVFFIGDSR
ncbi:MAG: Fatty acid-binding protein [Eubacteriales bacterium SKADARSKE-1]|nr:Fatty acid-binding protein [Eubacteriales bacterium SKADARSKE-1]